MTTIVTVIEDSDGNVVIETIELDTKAQVE
jgi:hypothetical protein